MDNRDFIFQYLADTGDIRDFIKPLAPLDVNEDGSMESCLAPWSVSSIVANTGMNHDAVMEALKGVDHLTLKEEHCGGHREIIVSGDRFRGHRTEATGTPNDVMDGRVSSAFNLHVYQFILSQAREGRGPVKIEDAIFDLKNSLMLPDDFMPEHLMGMVEGETALSIDQVRKAYEIVPGKTSIYLYPEQKKQGFGRVRFLYPASSFSLADPVSNETIRDAISASFGGLSDDPRFGKFESSRLLRSVIYNMERKNSRILRKPVFDSRKIGILEKMGIIDTSGDTTKVRDGVSADDLRSMVEEAGIQTRHLAHEWLESKIDLGNLSPGRNA